MGVIRLPFGRTASLPTSPVAQPFTSAVNQPLMTSPVPVMTSTVAGFPVGPTPAQLQDQIETRARAIANEIVAQTARQAIAAANGRVFTRFDAASDIVDNQKTFVTTGLFSGNAATMSYVYTGSIQSAASKTYYYDAWNGTTSTAEPQFAVSHGQR